MPQAGRLLLVRALFLEIKNGAGRGSYNAVEAFHCPKRRSTRRVLPTRPTPSTLCIAYLQGTRRTIQVAG